MSSLAHTQTPRLRRNTFPSPDVFSPRYHFQMIWVNAITYPAQMINNQLLRNHSDQRFIGKPVNIPRSATLLLHE